MRDLCAIHKLVLAPDGKCVVCRRPPKPLFTVSEEQETLISHVFTGLLGLGFLVGIGSLAYMSRLDTGYTGGRVHARELQASVAQQTQPGAAQQASAKTPAGTTQAAGAKAADAVIAEETASTQAEASDARVKQARALQQNAAPAKPPPRMPAAALQQVEVVMYATPWCDICDRARSFLRARQVVLIEHDIDGDEAAAAKLGKFNPTRSVPTFEIGGQAHVGFNPWDIEDALHRAAAQQGFAARAPRVRTRP